jgi:hypothetical protein
MLIKKNILNFALTVHTKRGENFSFYPAQVTHRRLPW